MYVLCVCVCAPVVNTYILCIYVYIAGVCICVNPYVHPYIHNKCVHMCIGVICKENVGGGGGGQLGYKKY